MRSWLARFSTIATGLLVVACTSAPTPIATLSPSGSMVSSTPAGTPRSTPIPTPAGPVTIAIAAGYTHTCVLTSSGGVRCWGSNHNGELGNGRTSDAAGPGPVDVAGLSSGVIAIAAGGMHTCALTSGGGVKCWGYNMYGQLGNGAMTDSSVPVDVVGLSSGVTAISVGWSHTCAITSGGGVKCWGNNLYGWVGDGTTTDRSVPVDVVGLGRGISAVATGTLHTCALTTGGGVKCWGYGQSDDATVIARPVPADVRDLGSGVTAIAAGLDRTCAVTSDGGVTCWGAFYTYVAPPGEPFPGRMVQLDVSGLASGIASLAMAGDSSCAVTNDGGVACWDSSNVPIAVGGLASGVSLIAVGGMHTCAATSGGQVQCWGSNVSGQLGSVMRCSSTSVPVDVVTQPGATPAPTTEPSSMPIGRIDHATGPTEVVLRFDRGPDFAVGDLVGELFQPGPEFTLYGDGTVIFRNEGGQPPRAEGPMVRGRPFMIGRLDEAKVQTFLRFALGEGGLWDACESYGTHDTDVASVDVFTVRAGGLEKRVENLGDAPFEALYDRLRNFESGAGIPTQVWVPNRFTGNLLDASIFANIGDGLVPGLGETGSVPWPWPGIAPADFVGLAEFNPGRRVMSAAEAAALGLSEKGGVVQRIYLRGPDGEKLFYFSLWPMSPDETT